MLSPAQFEINNAVATLGTALTEIICKNLPLHFDCLLL